MESYKFGEPGTLYFMVEKDRFSGDSSAYLKIGITNGDRDVRKRESEHQTGNPRAIITYHEIQSPGVQMIETFMHNHFAEHRVKGEWFKVTSHDIDLMISTAENKATEINAYEEDLNFDSNLDSLQIVEDSEVIVEDEEGLSLDQIPSDVLEAHKELIVHRANKKALASKLVSLRTETDHPEEMFKRRETKPSTNIEVRSVRKLFPELAKEFEITKGSWKHTLTFLESASSDGAKAQPIDIDSFGNDMIALHSAYLKTWSAIATHQWDFQIAQAQLLRLCGDAKTLQLCGHLALEWRFFTKNTFAKEDFEAKYPAEAAQCTKTTEGGESFSVAEWRAY